MLNGLSFGPNERQRRKERERRGERKVAKYIYVVVDQVVKRIDYYFIRLRPAHHGRDASVRLCHTRHYSGFSWPGISLVSLEILARLVVLSVIYDCD